jgi:hypothetical protein
MGWWPRPRLASARLRGLSVSKYYPFTRAGFTIAQVQDLVSLNTTELTGLDGITPGTVTASKALVVDANKDLASLRHLTLTGNLVVGATTISETDIAKIDGITNGSPTASKAVVLDANSLFDGTKLQGWDSSLAAAGTAFAPSSSSEAVMNLGSYTIAANRLQALGCIEFEAAVLIGAVNPTDTFTLNVRLGSANDATGTIVALKVLGATTAANDYAIVRGRINVRSIVTTTCTMTSLYSASGLLAGSAANTTDAFVGAFTKDSTAALYLNACGKWSTASGTNSATLQVFNVRVLGA